VIFTTFEGGAASSTLRSQIGLCDEKGRTHLQPQAVEWCYIAQALDERGL